MSSLYILEIRPLSEVSLANMFSHTVGTLFILIMFSLAMQKLFILMRFHLFILSLLHCWGDCRLVQPLWKTTVFPYLEFPQKTKNGSAF